MTTHTQTACPRKNPVSAYTCTPCGNGPCRAELQTQAAATDIHSCGYHCDRPACIKAQRAELMSELAKAKLDAARYQFMKTRSRGDLFDLGLELAWHEPTQNLDDLITAAMQQEQK